MRDKEGRMWGGGDLLLVVVVVVVVVASCARSKIVEGHDHVRGRLPCQIIAQLRCHES